MKHKLILLILFLLYIAITDATAQYENVWAFGTGAGIDFNSNPPKAIKTSMRTSEGSSSICNAAGELLFYTDGTSIWNRNHDLMPNGKILPDGSTRSIAQAAMIVPIPGKSGQYYVFSLTGLLYYNIVDMSLDNGLGDVVAGEKTQLSGRFSEYMIAVSGNNCNIWLLVQAEAAAELRAYNIGFNGIDTTPVITPKTLGTGVYSGYIGTMAISPDRSKLAIAQGNLVIYDFDGNTGKINNEIILDNGSNYYGVVFSADNTKLYCRTSEPVFQFDLSAGNAIDIVASKTLILNNSTLGSGMLQRGPDGKIYIVRDSGIGIIHKPNFQGLSCDYERGGLQLLPGTTSSIGFPSFATLVLNNKFYSSSIDNISCADSFLLTAKNLTGTNYRWNDGASGANRQVYSSGTYWLSYQVLNDKCDEYVDTFHVIIYNIKKNYTTTTFIGKCQADTFTMIANNLNQTHYLWEDSITTGKIRKVNKSGVYWVTYPSDSLCAHYVDTFIVIYPEKDYEVSFHTDTLVCEHDLIQFKNTSDPHFNSFTWSFGNGDSSHLQSPQYSYIEAGNYEVRLIGKIDSICPDTAFKTIIVDPLLFSHFIKDPDSICVGESITLSHKMTGNTIHNLHWQFGDGMELLSKDNRIQHAYDIAGIMPVTLSAQFRACADSSYTDTIYVFDLPKVDLGADSSICLNGAPLYLKNLQPEAEGLFHYVWNTGAETEMLKVTHPGTYSLTVSSFPMGCSSTGTVAITRDCYLDIPNAFTPDGDGINDYFFPRQLLSKNLTRFKMQILNRWGQVIFETTNVDGRGWDGRFNGKEQPAGAYVYSVEVEINGRVEQYQGNVTLIR